MARMGPMSMPQLGGGSSLAEQQQQLQQMQMMGNQVSMNLAGIGPGSSIADIKNQQMARASALGVDPSSHLQGTGVNLSHDDAKLLASAGATGMIPPGTMENARQRIIKGGVLNPNDPMHQLLDVLGNDEPDIDIGAGPNLSAYQGKEGYFKHLEEANREAGIPSGKVSYEIAHHPWGIDVKEQRYDAMVKFKDNDELSEAQRARGFAATQEVAKEEEVDKEMCIPYMLGYAYSSFRQYLEQAQQIAWPIAPRRWLELQRADELTRFLYRNDNHQLTKDEIAHIGEAYRHMRLAAKNTRRDYTAPLNKKSKDVPDALNSTISSTLMFTKKMAAHAYRCRPSEFFPPASGVALAGYEKVSGMDEIPEPEQPYPFPDPGAKAGMADLGCSLM